MKSIIGLAVVAIWAFTNVVEAQKTLEEIATHSTANNCWTAVGGTAYEITNFIPSHPNNEILFMCGRDATTKFDGQHSRTKFTTYSTKVRNLGPVVNAAGNPAPVTAPGPAPGSGFDSNDSEDGYDDSGEDDSGDYGGFGKCFSGDMMVQLEKGGLLEIRHLKVGDRVKVDVWTNKYEPVYGFAKRDETLQGDYLKLGWKSEDGRKYLELTPNHMLQVSRPGQIGWKMIPASLVSVGDEVQVDGTDETIARITSIAKVIKEGTYAPLLFSGKLVVNNVQASTYVSYQNTENLILGGGTTLGVTWQWLAQTFLLPVRWVGASLAAPLKVDIFSFLPSFFLTFEKVLVSILSLPAPILLPFAVPVIASMGFIYLSECLVLAATDHKLLLATLMLAGIAFRQSWKASGMTLRGIKQHKVV